MRNKIVATFVVVFLANGFVGCKSAPKMPWSKTAAVSNEDAATLAHSAPALPADIAKQAEALATTSPAIDLAGPKPSGSSASGGQAPLYSQAPAFTPSTTSLAVAPAPSPTAGSVATTTPTAYPTTGAAPYSSVPAATIAATTPSVPAPYKSTDKSAALGSISMPYNPNAVPPAKTIAATPAPVTPQISADRYGSSSVASSEPASSGGSLPPVANAAAPKPSSVDRYASAQTAAAPAGTAPRYGTMPSSNNRYATSNTVVSSVVDSSITPTLPSMPAIPQQAAITPATPANTASLVASASPYRPGGTTSYAGLGAGQSAAEIATRTRPTDGQVPNVAAPGTTPEPSQAPRYR